MFSKQKILFTWEFEIFRQKFVDNKNPIQLLTIKLAKINKMKYSMCL